MTRLLTLLTLGLALAAHGAPTVSLAWDPSPDADVNNYRLYWGPTSGSYTNHADLGNVTNTVFTQLAPNGHYWFVVTALNVGGAESDPSNEIDFQVPVTRPKKLRIVQSLQTAASPAGPWQEIGTLSSLIVPKEETAFYRVEMAITPPPLP